MANVFNLFKKGVPSQKKFYLKYKENRPELNELTYKQFKKNNYELDEFYNYFMNMSRYEFLSTSEIVNIFNYLANNLRYERYSTLKNVIESLNKMRDDLILKRKVLTDTLDNELAKSIETIVSNILMLKQELANRFNYNSLELENAIKFEKVTRGILNPEVIDEFSIIGNILDNLEILNYRDLKGRSFSDLLYKYIVHAKTNKLNDKLDYYTILTKYVMNIKSININKDVLDILNLNKTPIIGITSALDEKIQNLQIDERTGRYILKDFIISIDNDDTRKIDDALSIEKTPLGNYIVGIHITDVYSLGIFANELLNCKKEKEHVCKIKASLKEFQKKNCISLFLEISSNGNILNHKLLPTRLEVDRNLLYNDVSKIIHQIPNSEYTKTIFNLTSLCSALENNKLNSTPNIETLPHIIVNKLMLLYGCIVSEEFINKNIPGIYLSGDQSSNFYTTKKSSYDTGFDCFDSYTKATKPMYDKSSELCQYIIHKCIFNKISIYEKEALAKKMELVADSLNRKSK